MARPDMRVDRLDLHSYGALRGARLDLTRPTDGITIILGPNEAGKSTTMRAMDAVLYGIERGSGDHFGNGRQSLRVGALLRSADGTTLDIIRQGLNKAPLVDVCGEPVAETVLAAMLGNIDRALFRTLFRIDHRELSERSEELLHTDGEIGRLVFGASLGSVALTGVLKTLEDRSAKLFKGSARKSLAHEALLNYRSLAKEARDLRVRPKEWVKLDADLKNALTKIAALEERQRELRRSEAKLKRAKAALPLLAQRAGLLAELEAIRAAGPVHPVAWADEVDQWLQAASDAELVLTSSESQRDSIESTLGGINVDEGLLDNADRITALHERVGLYRKDRLDLPKLAEKMRGHASDARALVDALGVADESTAEALLRLSDAQRKDIERLAQCRSQIDSDLDAARSELAATITKITKHEQQLSGRVQPPDTSTLAHATAAATALGPIEDQIQKLRASTVAQDAEAQHASHRLGLGDRPLDDIESMVVPTKARVTAERATRTEVTGVEKAIADRLAALDAERQKLVAERANVGDLNELPDADSLEAARTHRDTGWQLVRATLHGATDPSAVEDWSQMSPLPDAYETAVHDADVVADRRYGHAEQLTKLERIGQRIEEIADQVAECSTEGATLVERLSVVESTWAAEWELCGISMSSPDEASEWLDGHKDLLNLLSTRRQAAAELGQLEALLGEHEVLLRGALVGLGQEPETGGLGVLMGQSTDVSAATGKERSDLDSLTQKLDEAREERGRRESAVTLTQAQVTEWTQDWEAALEPLGLPPSTSTDAALITVGLIIDLRKKRSDEQKDKGRHDGLLADVDSFAASSRPAVAELAPDLLESDLADAISNLHGRLGRATKELVRHQELTKQRDGFEGDAAAARLAAEEALTQLTGLRDQVGMGLDDALPPVVQRSRDTDETQQRLDTVEQTLIGMGDGKSVIEIREETAAFDMDGDRVAAEALQNADEISGLDDELGDANATRGEIKNQVDQIDGSAAAADLEQRAAESQANVAQLLDEYTRVTLASAILKRVVASYGEQNQRPILEDAAATFTALTLGAFDGLIVEDEGDKQVLLARRRNGEMLRTSALSSGTRDQLYLALRLAGLRHQLDRVAEPLPLILDDLLVNFDDRRSQAALEVLADMGSQTQVLMFTHEQNLAALAQTVLGPDRCTVVTLSERDHDLTPVTPPTKRLPRTARSVDGDGRDRVVECLGAAAKPLGKAEILQRTGLTEGDWGRTIKALVDDETVVRQGEKRGARYELRT